MTSIIALLVIVIKNKQMEYIEQNRRNKFDFKSLVIVLNEKFGCNFVRLPNIIKHNQTITW